MASRTLKPSTILARMKVWAEPPHAWFMGRAPSKTATLLHSLTPEQIHAICAARMSRIDVLPAELRAHVHEIGWERFQQGYRAPLAYNPTPRNSKAQLQIQERGRKVAARLGLKVCRAASAPPKLVKPEDFGL